jgi:hypothetical protein
VRKLILQVDNYFGVFGPINPHIFYFDSVDHFRVVVEVVRTDNSSAMPRMTRGVFQGRTHFIHRDENNTFVIENEKRNREGRIIQNTLRDVSSPALKICPRFMNPSNPYVPESSDA